MNTPLSWIKAYVPELDCSVKEYCDAMTLSGTKVESAALLDKNLSKIEEQVKEDEYEQEISDDDKVILNSENLLYSETIPRILADFLQKNTGIGIITCGFPPY